MPATRENYVNNLSIDLEPTGNSQDFVMLFPLDVPSKLLASMDWAKTTARRHVHTGISMALG